ncbi:MAG: glycosyltransferase, partial [archaeon]
HGDAFGLSLMEAVAIGKPVICTDGIGSQDNKKDEVLVVERDNSEELAGLLEKILTDKKFRQRAIKVSRRLAHTFNKDEVMKKYIKIYKEIS